MKIEWFCIRSFKNLQQFRIEFKDRELTTVLIGVNGAGKSNLIEALALLFRELDLSERNHPPFECALRYRCRGRAITIRTPTYCEPEEKPWKGFHIRVEGPDGAEDIAWTRFRAERDALLPQYVFAYYSGPGDRLHSYFLRHQERFYREIIDDDSGATPDLRRLFYCLPEHSQFVLLAYFFQKEELPEFLREFFGIDGFDSALLVLHQPWWNRGERTVSPVQRERGDERFWYARGLVRDFLRKVWDQALAPIYDVVRPEGDFRGKGKQEERLYLYVPDVNALRNLTEDWVTPSDFFASLESSYLSDLTREARIWVRCGDEVVPFVELSEGEKQLLSVVGLLRFTRHEESLFLLDEPDTHLNPRWKLRYLDVLRKEVGVFQNSQMLISTHDPLTIAGLEAGQVQIFERSDSGITTRSPDVDPRGMGVAGVLLRMFGLPSTLDPQTQRKLDRRNELSAKEPRDEEENAEMAMLSRELGNLGLLYEARDPKYQKFLEAVHDWERRQARSFAAISEEERASVAEEIIDRIFGKSS